jgi:hypothetical protein
MRTCPDDQVAIAQQLPLRVKLGEGEPEHSELAEWYEKTIPISFVLANQKTG